MVKISLSMFDYGRNYTRLLFKERQNRRKNEVGLGLAMNFGRSAE